MLNVYVSYGKENRIDADRKNNCKDKLQEDLFPTIDNIDIHLGYDLAVRPIKHASLAQEI